MQTNPIAVGLNEAAKLSGLGRTTLYRFARNGKLPLRRCGGRTLVLVDDLRKLIETEAA
jgi:excisionase family DNA binding protein